MADGPRRRIEVTLKLSADSWQEVSWALRELSTDCAIRPKHGTSVSGGVGRGYIWSADEDDAITHESWYAELENYLNAERRAEGEGE